MRLARLPLNTTLPTTCPYFAILKFDIFAAAGLNSQCHFITSVLRSGRYQYVH